MICKIPLPCPPCPQESPLSILVHESNRLAIVGFDLETNSGSIP